MHTHSLIAALALAGLIVVPTVQARGDAKPSDRDVRGVADANNAFTLDLYTTLKDQPGNLFFSPLSISTALAMTEGGAAGNTQAQLLKGLHLDGLQPGVIPAAMAELTRMIRPTGDRPGYELVIANALWPRAGFTLNADYARLIQDDFGGTLTPLDFTKPAAAAKAINDWVARRTNDRIKNLVPPSALDRNTRLVLTNAVYFKGAWEVRFPERATREEPFATGTGLKVQVPMMHKTARFFYKAAPSAQVLKLDYQGGGLSMVILLPDRGSSLGTLEKNLATGGLDQWLSGLQSREVAVSLPRFGMTYEVMLNTALQALGMTDAFDATRADFSGIASQDRLYISAAIHKAFVDVNEQGTEAAAATGMVMGATAMPAPREAPIEFRADHPFLFMIQHASSGTVLFMGRVMNPKE